MILQRNAGDRADNLADSLSRAEIVVLDARPMMSSL